MAQRFKQYGSASQPAAAHKKTRRGGGGAFTGRYVRGVAWEEEWWRRDEGGGWDVEWALVVVLRAL